VTACTPRLSAPLFFRSALSFVFPALPRPVVFHSTLCTVETKSVDSRETAVSHAGLWKTAKSGHSGLLKKSV
jgi:hypothetical protein